ncbi:MAG: mechanosensitive ion channel family protein [Desulfurococcales archaeon]|nr:mechanosensitive ion channel family protein [Desulfurococcales archaeon]
MGVLVTLNQAFTAIVKEFKGSLGNLNAADIIAASIVIILSYVIAVVSKKLVEKPLRKVAPQDIATLVSRVVYYTVLFFGLLSVLALFNISLSGLLVAGGIAGIVIGFASQTVFSNFLSGLFIYFDKPFKIGDAIEIGGESGIVTDINVFSTRIRRWDGVHIRIPNEDIFKSQIKNLIQNKVRRVDYTIGISYQDDPEKARAIIGEHLEKHPLVLAEPLPTVFLSELGDSALVIQVRFWTLTKYWFQAKTSILEELYKKLTDNGITIPFPQQTIWFANTLEHHNTSIEPGKHK